MLNRIVCFYFVLLCSVVSSLHWHRGLFLTRWSPTHNSDVRFPASLAYILFITYTTKHDLSTIRINLTLAFIRTQGRPPFVKNLPVTNSFVRLDNSSPERLQTAILLICSWWFFVHSTPRLLDSRQQTCRRLSRSSPIHSGTMQPQMWPTHLVPTLQEY